MSGAAWLAARLAGYLGGWQTLLDSDCVCIPVCVCGITLCPRQVSVHGQWCVPSLPLSPCPEKSNQGDNLLPLIKKSFQSGEGSSPRRQAHRGALCLSLALNRLASLPLEVPSSQWKTQYTIVLAVAIKKKEEKKSLFSSQASILESALPTDHQLTRALLFIFTSFSSWLWLCNDEASLVCVLLFFKVVPS